MKFQIKSGPAEQCAGDVFVYFQEKPLATKGKFFAWLEGVFSGGLKKVAGPKLFSGATKKVFSMPTFGRMKAGWLVLCGLGEKKSRTQESWRLAAGAAVKEVQRLGGSKPVFYLEEDCLEGDLPGQEIAAALMEGALLADYKFSRKGKVAASKEEKPEDEADEKQAPEMLITLVTERAQKGFAAGLAEGRVNAEAQCLTRELSNLPANEAAPETIVALARKKLAGLPLKITVLDEKAIRRERMGMLLAVAQGSAASPRVLVIEWNPGKKSRGTVALVGKGVVFDTGGISIKPAGGMEEMKHDKSGAAAVIGAMQAIARFKPALRVVGVAGFVENMPDGNAIRPGDIVTSRSGLTVQIDNTDAEGRLVLGDLMDYVKQFNPDWAMDQATLTGACHVALGSEYAGAFTASDRLFELTQKAADKAGEKIWRMPLGGKWSEDVRGKTADLVNVGSRYGGASFGATFINQFAKGYDHLHLDIAGMANGKATPPLFAEGATGYGAKLFIEAVRLYAEKPFDRKKKKEKS